MPRYIRLIGRYGNGLCALFFLALLPYSVTQSVGMALATAAFLALAGFNLYVVEKAAYLTSEEAWLKAEIRRAELRKRLADLGGPLTEGHTVIPPAAEPRPDQSKAP